MLHGEKKYILFITLLMLVACSHQRVASSDEKNSYILKFKAGISESIQKQVLGDLELKEEKKLDLVGAIVCSYRGDLTAEELIKKSKEYPEIEYLEPDFTVQTQK